MPTPTLSPVDRLRIERVVWTLDQHLYDIPRHARIAHRREVRENLHNAAADVGTSVALKRLGNVGRLAESYRTAEFGDRLRPAWYSAAIFFLTAQLVFTALLAEAVNAFAAGISAADPHASGRYVWSGIAYLQTSVTYTLRDGHASSTGGAWTPLAWVLWGLATVVVGRLWRVLPGRRAVQAA